MLSFPNEATDYSDSGARLPFSPDVNLLLFLFNYILFPLPNSSHTTDRSITTAVHFYKQKITGWSEKTL